MAIKDTTRPRILLISLTWVRFFDKVHEPLLIELASKGRVKRARRAGPALRLLSEQPPPSAAIITDEALMENEYAYVWKAVIQYVRQGGTCVIMGHFPGFGNVMDLKPFFATAGLPWESSLYYKATHVLNRQAVGDDLAAKLPPQYSQKARFLKNVASSDAWYLTDENSAMGSHVKAAVVFASVERGKLGYVGDVNAEKSSEAVILAMCGL